MSTNTMESQIDKARWVTDLWEECRYDDAMRDLVFAKVVDEVTERLQDEVHDEVEESLEDEWIEHPPAKVEQLIRHDYLEELKTDPPKELCDAVKIYIQGDLDDKTSDLEHEIFKLRDEIRELKRKTTK